MHLVRSLGLLGLLCFSGCLWARGTVIDTGLNGLLERYCFDCHDSDSAKGGLDLESLNRGLSDAETTRRWIRVHDQVAQGEMPPKKKDQPDARERAALLESLAGSLHAADALRKEVVFRRLNRREFENTLRDLFSLPHLEVRDLLPADPVAHGFNNVGESLALSKEQMMAYFRAIDRALDEVLLPLKPPEARRFSRNFNDPGVHTGWKQARKIPDLGGVAFWKTGPRAPGNFQLKLHAAGNYRFKLHLRAFQSDAPVTAQITAGGVDLPFRETRKSWLQGFYDAAPGPEWTVIEFEEYLAPGDSIRVQPVRLGYQAPKDLETTDRPGLLVGDLIVEGPINAAWPPPGRRELLGDINPESANEKDAMAVLARFLPRAFRRDTTGADLQPFADLTRRALAMGRPWMESLRLGLEAILVAPGFLFLDEPGSPQIDDIAIASRLSYLLWKSAPDEALLRLARSGALNKNDALRNQVERMLADPRSNRFVEDFTDQWLALKDIDATAPDAILFPEFDDLLKYSLVKETRHFFREMLDRDLPVGEFVSADWTMLNGPLARHYRIPDVAGIEFRRVTLPRESVRGGLLAQGAIHKVTANGTITSPVIRGNWVLENILGAPVPPPPANVPAVEPDITGAATLRQQLHRHRESTACAGCHKRIDPPGFALEVFNPIGGEREWYRATGKAKGQWLQGVFVDPPFNTTRIRYKRGLDVDAAGVTEDGAVFADFREYKAHLARRPEIIVRALAEKLLVYGSGRGLGFSDRPIVDALIERLRTKEFRFRALLHEVVQSTVFRTK